MNKRYMDFVPVSATRKIVDDDFDKPAKKSVASSNKTASAKTKTEPSRVSSDSYEPQLGVIEDLQPKFVKTEVAKRPLGSGRQAKKAELTTEYANKQRSEDREKIYRNAIRSADKVVSDAPVEDKKSKQRTEMRTPFVNTEKVTKRPLSKNVYQKKVVEPKEEESKPITIITSEKKDSKIGIVVAVIITIILGATAGTVAFLLLPK